MTYSTMSLLTLPVADGAAQAAACCIELAGRTPAYCRRPVCAPLPATGRSTALHQPQHNTCQSLQLKTAAVAECLVTYAAGHLSKLLINITHFANPTCTSDKARWHVSSVHQLSLLGPSTTPTSLALAEQCTLFKAQHRTLNIPQQLLHL
jgi:hypothetical protein